MERRGTPSSTSVVRPRQRQPRAPQLPSMASSVVPEHQRSAAQVIDLELSGRNIIPGKRQRTQSARAGDAAAAKPPPRKPGLRYVGPTERCKDAEIMSSATENVTQWRHANRFDHSSTSPTYYAAIYSNNFRTVYDTRYAFATLRLGTNAVSFKTICQRIISFKSRVTRRVRKF